jgi:hypothetical protein
MLRRKQWGENPPARTHAHTSRRPIVGKYRGLDRREREPGAPSHEDVGILRTLSAEQHHFPARGRVLTQACDLLLHLRGRCIHLAAHALARCLEVDFLSGTRSEVGEGGGEHRRVRDLPSAARYQMCTERGGILKLHLLFFNSMNEMALSQKARSRNKKPTAMITPVGARQTRSCIDRRRRTRWDSDCRPR